MNYRTIYAGHQKVDWLSVPRVASIILLTTFLLAGAEPPKLPTEAPWIVLSLVLVILFNRFLNLRLKLMVAACGLLAGLAHRALIDAFPKSRLTFTDWGRDPGEYVATYFVMAAASVVLWLSGYWPKQKPESEPKKPDLLVIAAATNSFIRTRCAPFTSSHPFLTLSLFSSLIFILLFVQFDHANSPSAVANDARSAMSMDDAVTASTRDKHMPRQELGSEEAYKSWKRYSHSLSLESRRRLVAYLTQRVEETPWRVDLVWDLYAARRLASYRIQIPTPQTMGLVLLCGLLIRGLPRMHRRASLKRQAFAQQARRIVPALRQVIRTVIFDSSNGSPQFHTRNSKGRK